MIVDYTFDTGGATGGAGVATATSPSKMVRGKILAVGVTYLLTPPATTNIILRTRGEHGPAQTVLSIPNANTNAWFYPRVSQQDNAGVAKLYAAAGEEVATEYVVADNVELNVAQANDDDSVTVVLLVDEG